MGLWHGGLWHGGIWNGGIWNGGLWKTPLGPPSPDLIAYFKDGVTDSVGLSVSDYDKLGPLIQPIFFIDPSTLRDTAEAYALALASPHLNKINMFGSDDKGVAVYPTAISIATYYGALKYFKQQFIPSDIPGLEAAALILFYNQNAGEVWPTQTGWTIDTTVGDWSGITVTNGRIVEVNLYDNGITHQQMAFFDGVFQITRDTIKAQAGILDGVTIGVDPLVTPGLVGAVVDQVGILEITSEAGAIAAASSGTGTYLDPYVIANKKWASLATIGFYWNDPDADYYCKLYNCHWSLNAVANIRVNISSAQLIQAGLFVSQSLLYNYVSGVDHIILDSGYLKVNATNFNRAGSTSALVSKQGGDSCVVDVADCLHDGSGTGYLFQNHATGGEINVLRFTSGDIGTSKTILFVTTKDVKITADRVRVDSLHVVWDAGSTTAGEDLTLGFTLTNSSLIAINNTLFGNAEDNKATMHNARISHCYFYSDVVGSGGIRMGPKGTVAGNSNPKNILISHCLFERPDTPSNPGEEMCELFGAENCCMEHNWTINTEDAYEYHTCRDGNVVRYCGGENVQGQMVDMYVSVDTPGYHVHHIYGECLDAAVLVTNTKNALIHDIYTDNALALSPGGSYGSGTGAVVIEYRGSIPDNIKVLGPIPQIPQSAQGVQLATIGEVGSNIYADYFNGGERVIVGTDFEVVTGV